MNIHNHIPYSTSPTPSSFPQLVLQEGEGSFFTINALSEGRVRDQKKLIDVVSRRVAATATTERYGSFHECCKNVADAEADAVLVKPAAVMAMDVVCNCCRC